MNDTEAAIDATPFGPICPRCSAPMFHPKEQPTAWTCPFDTDQRYYFDWELTAPAFSDAEMDALAMSISGKLVAQ